jgi:hypothetical protein
MEECSINLNEGEYDEMECNCARKITEGLLREYRALSCKGSSKIKKKNTVFEIKGVKGETNTQNDTVF